MKLILYIAVCTLLSCKHPESNENERFKSGDTREVKKADNNRSVIKMQKRSGVYEIPVWVNGIEMEFIFDTGAGIISISEVEANFLFRQGKISKEDILGTANFTDANGDISEGTIINLKTVKIGNHILYDVEASVVHNQKAPLLLGQSALSRFGKVSVDYNTEELTLE